MKGRAADKGRAEARRRFQGLVEPEQPEPQASGSRKPDMGQGARGQRVNSSTARDDGHLEALRRFGTAEEKAAVEQMAPTKVTHTKYTPREYEQSLPRPTTYLDD